MNIKIDYEAYNANKNRVSYNLNANNFYSKDSNIIQLGNQSKLIIANDVKNYMNLFFSTFFSIKDEFKKQEKSINYSIDPYVKHFIQNIYSTNISSQVTLEKIMNTTKNKLENKKTNNTHKSNYQIEKIGYYDIELIHTDKNLIKELKTIYNFNKKEQEFLLLKKISSEYFNKFTNETINAKTNTYFSYLNDLTNTSFLELNKLSNTYAEELLTTLTINNNLNYKVKSNSGIIEKYNTLVQQLNDNIINNHANNNMYNKNNKQLEKEKRIKIIHNTLLNDTQTKSRIIKNTSNINSKNTEYKSGLNSKIPNIKFSDIIGLKRPKKEIKKFIYSKKYPDIFEKHHARGHSGILLHGPPGNGKTRFAQAIANELQVPFMNIGLTDILSKYYGESEQILQEFFNEGKKYENLIMFFDEIDIISPSRADKNADQKHRGILNVLLTNLDGFEKQNNIIPIGSTNIIHQIDPALKRNGRFSNIIEIKNPEFSDIIDMYKYKTLNEFNDLYSTINKIDEKSYIQLANESLGFSFANINEVIERAKDNSSVIEIDKKAHYNTTTSDIFSAIADVKEEIKFQ